MHTFKILQKEDFIDYVKKCIKRAADRKDATFYIEPVEGLCSYDLNVCPEFVPAPFYTGPQSYLAGLNFCDLDDEEVERKIHNKEYSIKITSDCEFDGDVVCESEIVVIDDAKLEDGLYFESLVDKVYEDYMKNIKIIIDLLGKE